MSTHNESSKLWQSIKFTLGLSLGLSIMAFLQNSSKIMAGAKDFFSVKLSGDAVTDMIAMNYYGITALAIVLLLGTVVVCYFARRFAGKLMAQMSTQAALDREEYKKQAALDREQQKEQHEAMLAKLGHEEEQPNPPVDGGRSTPSSNGRLKESNAA